MISMGTVERRRILVATDIACPVDIIVDGEHHADNVAQHHLVGIIRAPEGPVNSVLDAFNNEGGRPATPARPASAPTDVASRGEDAGYFAFLVVVQAAL